MLIYHWKFIFASRLFEVQTKGFPKYDYIGGIPNYLYTYDNAFREDDIVFQNQGRKSQIVLYHLFLKLL